MSLLSKIFPFLRNNAEKFEAWTIKVGKQDASAAGNIDLFDKDTDYMKGLEEFSEDYIKIIDTDDDKKISYDEFEKFNIEQAKDNLEGLSEKDIEYYKQILRNAYTNLNVNNGDDSKDTLDIKEVMNYFSLMDKANGDQSSNGNVSQYEYETTTRLLSTKPDEKNKYTQYVKDNYNKLFKT